jgi:hypothetical protein
MARTSTSPAAMSTLQRRAHMDRDMWPPRVAIRHP